MQDQPTPSEVLAAVARFLKDVVAAETTGHTSFNARVAANALEMMRRQLDLAPAAETAEQARLESLLGAPAAQPAAPARGARRRAATGDLTALNAELSRRLAAGELDLETRGLADHLWQTTLAKLAVDQPTYWGYRAALAERAPTKD